MNPKKALQLIAAENGCSVAEVRREINKAIDEGMKSTDPKAMELWASIPRKGDKPTPEEVIKAVSKRALNQMNADKATRISGKFYS